MALAAILVVELLRSRIDVVVTAGAPSIGIWRSIRFVLGHAQLRVLGWSAFVYVIAQHTFTFYLVTYLYEHCGLSIARAGLLLSVSQIAGTGDAAGERRASATASRACWCWAGPASP